MGIKDMTQEQADTIGWMIAACMFLLPLGWVFFHVSIGHAVFAITQGAFVILAITWIVGTVYRRSRSPELAVLVAALTYLVSCFLTNWIGALILERGWKHWPMENQRCLTSAVDRTITRPLAHAPASQSMLGR